MRLTNRIEGPVAVIGDVHGQIEQLETVLDRLRQLPNYEQRWIVFIGDLVDRGPDTKAVLDLVSDLLTEHPKTAICCGNHELAMAGALGLIPTPEYANWAERWLADYGAQETFASYDVPFGELENLKAKLGEQHTKLLSDLPWAIEHPQYLFVHAGLDANTPFAMQLRILKQRDFTLNRPQWLCSKSLVTSPIPADCPVTVVSGHVQVPEVTFSSKRILIDTTGGLGGDLSCVLLPEKKVLTSGADPEPKTVAASRSATAPKSGRGASKSWWKLW